MPGMWELPSAEVNGKEPLMTLKHAITTTDYTVRVFEEAELCGENLRWFRAEELPRLPLTGLARKVLTRAGIIQ